MQETSKSDSRLYHYTTLEWFAGILDTDKLWASHIGYLNDTSEQKPNVPSLKFISSILSS